MGIIRRARKSSAHLGVATVGFAVGAAAVGALAIGAIAIRRFVVGHGRIDKLHIRELTVDTLIVNKHITPPAQG